MVAMGHHHGLKLLTLASTMVCTAAWAQPTDPPAPPAPTPTATATAPPAAPPATAVPAPAPTYAPAPTAAPPATSQPAPAAAAQPAPAAAAAPAPEDRWWEQVQPEPRTDVGKPIATVGIILTGLGGATVFAAGVSWLVAAANAARLDDNCPDKQCVEGTRGADDLQTARDAAAGAGILTAIGAPVLASGVILWALGAAGSPTNTALQVVPTPAGVTVRGRF